MTSSNASLEPKFNKFLTFVSDVSKLPLSVVLTFAAVALSGYLVINNLFQNPFNIQSTVEMRNLIIGGVQNRQELVTASTKAKSTVIVERERMLWKLPLGETSIVYEGIGRINAGVNLSQIQVKSVNRRRGSIAIELPAPYISTVGMDGMNSGVLQEKRDWFGPRQELDMQDEAQQEAISNIRAEACENRILETATHNAERLIRNLLTEADFEDITFTSKPDVQNICPIA